MASETAGDFSSILSRECIDIVNRLLNSCELSIPRINSIEDINSSLIILLFENITEYKIPDLISDRDTVTDVHNVQAVIDCLSLDLLGLSLSHITGESVVSGDVVAISNLLEVLEAVAVHLLGDKNVGNVKDKTILPKAAADSSSVKKSSKPVDNENISTAKVLKRKICKNTLRNFKATPVKKSRSVCSPLLQAVDKHEVFPECGETESKQIQRQECENSRETAKKDYVRNAAKVSKKCEIQDVEKIFERNYEQRIQGLVLNAKKYPKMRAQQMKHSFLRTLKSPMKRKSIPYCRKSFLLPYNLRPKSAQQSPRRILNKEKKTHLPTCAKSEKQSSDQDVPEKIQNLLKEFPGFEFPKNTLSLLTEQYYHHLSYLHKELRNTYIKKYPKLIQAQNTAKQQSILSDLLAKDIKEMNTLIELNDHKATENRIKYSLRDARLRSAALKKYFNEFHSSMKKKLQNRNFTEELIVQETFRDMLKLEKEEVQELCKRVKEADNIDAKHYKQYLCSLQNLYKDQLSMLAESVEAEQKDLFARIQSQKQDTERLNRDIRNKLQKDVRSLQKEILEAMKDTHFRKLDAENFISRI